jgi:peptide/nickel transport system ATP-binding protein
VIAVENLGLVFRRHDGRRDVALEGITLHVARGELVGLVGASGAGKSLVAETLLGLLPRNAERTGRVRAEGRLALIPQGRDALDPLLPVGPQVRRMARLAGRRVEVGSLLASVGLSPSIERLWPHELSGGMARRVLIAQALATGTKGLVADEPSAGLHPEAAEQVMALLRDLSRQGCAVLVISHDLRRLAAVADRIVVLRDGRHVETAEASAFAAGTLREQFTLDLWEAQDWASAGPC